jgi:hypothetical protein
MARTTPSFLATPPVMMYAFLAADPADQRGDLCGHGIVEPVDDVAHFTVLSHQRHHLRLCEHGAHAGYDDVFIPASIRLRSSPPCSAQRAGHHLQKAPGAGGAFVVHGEVQHLAVRVDAYDLAVLTADVDDRPASGSRRWAPLAWQLISVICCRCRRLCRPCRSRWPPRGLSAPAAARTFSGPRREREALCRAPPPVGRTQEATIFPSAVDDNGVGAGGAAVHTGKIFSSAAADCRGSQIPPSVSAKASRRVRSWPLLWRV